MQIAERSARRLSAASNFSAAPTVTRRRNRKVSSALQSFRPAHLSTTRWWLIERLVGQLASSWADCYVCITTSYVHMAVKGDEVGKLFEYPPP